MGAEPLLPALHLPATGEAIRFGDRVLSYPNLASVAADVATRVRGADRVAVWATASPETCAAVVGALAAGAAIVPINPKLGQRELEHIVADSRPEAVLTEPGIELAGPLAELDVHTVDLDARGSALPAETRNDEDAALIIYTSGTTGLPKGVVLPRRAIKTNLDAVAAAWEWTGDDVLTHALPLFHVHGLILGVLGPLRLGGTLHHLGRFSPADVAAELEGSATMFFGVPTMYHRLAEAAENDHEIARGLAQARLLVSGSAPLPATEHRRIESLTGQRVVERYGMSETIMNCGVRASGERRPGYVGLPFDGVDVKLLDEQGHEVSVSDDETVGEIHVRGPNLFTGYLNSPDATAEAFVDGWFRTGDVATLAPDGYIRIVGRKATDLIKTGGYRVGAGEVENVLLEHPSVSEVAVAGAHDPDLGERILAWIVPNEHSAAEHELAAHLDDHLAGLLSPHKRPRTVHFVESLPRNEMGKVMKKALIDEAARMPT